jgi:hypothetical protein
MYTSPSNNLSVIPHASPSVRPSVCAEVLCICFPPSRMAHCAIVGAFAIVSYTTFNVTISVPGPIAHRAIVDQLASGVSPHLAVPLSSITVTVTNTGSVASDFAALLFLIPPSPGTNGAPLQALAGFDRIHLGPGQSQASASGWCQ